MVSVRLGFLKFIVTVKKEHFSKENKFIFQIDQFERKNIKTCKKFYSEQKMLYLSIR